MDIDERIAVIMKKMEKLSGKNPKFSCGKFPPEWGKPLSEEAVAEYERKNNIKLPADYRRFITTVAAKGTQPFYGMYSIVEELPQYEMRADVGRSFPYTVRKPLNISSLSDEEYDNLFEGSINEADAGYVLLCHEGCGMYSILVVNSQDEDTYGTAWYYDLCNDAGIYPLINPVSKKPMSFLDWLEYYVDRTLELSDDGYFGYSEVAGIVKD